MYRILVCRHTYCLSLKVCFDCLDILELVLGGWGLGSSVTSGIYMVRMDVFNKLFLGLGLKISWRFTKQMAQLPSRAYPISPW